MSGLTLLGMATITLSSDRFPVGTTVALYPAASNPHGSGDDRKPSGSAVAASTASSTATTTNASNQLTVVSPTTGWANGMVVSGTGIPAGTRIVSGAGTATMTMSQNATAGGSGVAITGTDGVVADDGQLRFVGAAADTSYIAYAQVSGRHVSVRARVDSSTGAASPVGTQGRGVGTGNTSSGSAALTSVAATTGAFQVGQQISGPGIPPGTYLIAGSGASWTMSDKATASASGVALEGHKANSWRATVMRRRVAAGTS